MPQENSVGERYGSLLTPGFLLVILTGFIFFFNFHSFLLLPLRIKQLGGTDSDIGFIMGVAGFSTLFATPAVGILVDRYGRRIFLLAGTLAMALSTLPFAFFDSINIFFPLLRLIQGAAFSLCFTSAGTLTADLTPPARRSQALGLFGVFTIVNYAIAPAVGKRIVERLGFDEFFVIIFAFGLLSSVIALLLREPPVVSAQQRTGGFVGTLGRKGVIVVALTLLISGSGFIPALTFLPVYSVEIGVPQFDLFFISYTLAALCVRLFGGWIPDRFGRKRTAVPALLFFAVSIASLSLAGQVAHFIPSALVFGLTHGFLYPSLYALVIDLVPQQDKGKGFSICSMSFTVGGMLGSFAYGVVAEASGYRAMYALSGGVCFLGFVLFSALAREARVGTSAADGSSE